MSAQPAEHELLATVRQLWPGAAVSADHGGPDGGPDGGPGAGTGLASVRYAVVPHARAPRMLVPLDPPAARVAALRRFSSASSVGEVALRAGVARLSRLAPAFLLPDRVRVTGGESALADHLSAVLGEPITFSLTIGAPRVNRKPVLELFDRTGRSMAFAKIGLTPNAANDVLAEGRALHAVRTRPLDLVVAPPLLAETTWNGHPLLVIGTLRAPIRLSLRRRSRPPGAAMDELADAFATEPAPLATSAWWARCWDDAARLEDVIVRERLVSCLEQMAAEAGRRRLEWGAWHGDWTPWNMARDGRRVLLWDWERFEADVPRGLDRMHYVVNRHTVRHGSTADILLEAVRLGATRADRVVRAGSMTPRLLGLLYLVAIATRYLRLVSATNGEHIADRAADTLIALERLLEG